MLSDPDFRDLATLPLPTQVLRAFLKTGHTTIGEVAGLTHEQISSICQIPRKKALLVVQILQDYRNLIVADGSTIGDPYRPHTALELLNQECCLVTTDDSLRYIESGSVLTMSKSFDELLGGGFPCGRITEVCGQPGIGKTQFCMQTCLTVQLPKWCSGLGGEAVFIDTEGNFMPKRLLQMADSLVTHCNRRILPRLEEVFSKSELRSKFERSPSDDSEYRKALASLPTTETLLRNVNYIRCSDYLQLLTAVRRLCDFCRHHPNVRLIVVDSIALPFRYEFDHIPQRNRLLAGLSQSLLRLAGTQNAAVIVTNQITTRFRADDECGSELPNNGQLVPALGDSWGHICSVRLLLQRSQYADIRVARLLKHPGRPPGIAKYQVTSDGIRDTF